MGTHDFVSDDGLVAQRQLDAEQRAELLRRLYRMSDMALGRAIIDLCRTSRRLYGDRFGPPQKRLRHRHEAGTILLWHVGPEIGARLIRRARAVRAGTDTVAFAADAAKNGSAAADQVDPLQAEERNALTSRIALDGPNGLRSWADHLLADASIQNVAREGVSKLIPDPLLLLTNEPCNGNPIAMALIRLGPPPVLADHLGNRSRGWCADNVFEVSRLRARAGGEFQPDYAWRPEFQIYDLDKAARLAVEEAVQAVPAPGAP